MADFSRRDFLKAVSLAGTAAAFGCSSDSPRKLIPYIVPPDDLVPGEASWYATTCRECPAGCGVLAKNREGRIVKLEGNPLHPINRGALCARGQAALQGLYNPDRLRGPMIRNSRGGFEPVSWEEAERLLLERLAPFPKTGRGERIVFLSELITGVQKDLTLRWLEKLGSASFFAWEPLAREYLREANRISFGLDLVPSYRLDRADFLISFGADFLETWLSNVEFARQFSAFHAPGKPGKNLFVYVGPRLSLTGANADQWVCVPPGAEHLVALGMIRVLFEENRNLRSKARPEIPGFIDDLSLEAVRESTGVSIPIIQSLARNWHRAQSPLTLSGETGGNQTEAAVAANLLGWIRGGPGPSVRFDDPSALSASSRAADLKELAAKMRSGEIDVLFLSNSNPVYALPPAWEFEKALKAVPFVVAFSHTPDETGRLAHLLLPAHSPLESWGDYRPRKSVHGLLQPVMGPVFNTRHLGDLLIATGQRLHGKEAFPWDNFYGLLRESWGKTPWEEALRRGGFWEGGKETISRASVQLKDFSFSPPRKRAKGEKTFHFLTYPTVQFFDGRGANRPWLQELPDPVAQTTWGTWVEIHPDTAAQMGVRRGDLVRLQSPHGSLEAPAILYPGIHPETLAVPLGQGHGDFGRFASRTGVNTNILFDPLADNFSGGLVRAVSGLRVEKGGGRAETANTDGSLYQHGRGFAQTVPLAAFEDDIKTGRKPHLRLPLPGDYDPKQDFYPPHPHSEYRWAMAVDLDRCVGCGACAVACSAENNVAVVGREQVLRGREMAWLRIERYFEPVDSGGGIALRFLPMLCQHCDNAPCESVCPVFAPHHSQDGLNNQIYNRCIGTRFCSQNCPYKVRRFNWFTFTHAEPLNWQLNPDVTVRQKGVMEKCSFCVQRIKAARLKAKFEERKVRDGEVTPACAQTCPAGAFTFGNLNDPQSRISKLIRDPRTYQVLEHLNTKPAVFYLKRITKKV
jgi:molybdopterin-containing oxidoreductase family iron-sulfur binding subunit